MFYYTNDDSLFGLKPEDLTVEQLKKVHIEKLIQMLSKDKRIGGVLSELIALDVNGTNISKYFSLSQKDWDENVEMKNAYNSVLNISNGFGSKLNSKDYYRSSRVQYIIWRGLNETRRLEELNRFLNNETHSVMFEELDYNWLEQSDFNFALKVCRKQLSDRDFYTKRMIRSISKTLITVLYPEIKTLHKYHWMELLANPNTPELYLESLLRVYAKYSKNDLIDVCVPIPKKVLQALPPVTRLDVLEKLVIGAQAKKIFVEFKTEEEIKELVFCVLTKYTDRVERLLKRYRLLLEKID